MLNVDSWAIRERVRFNGVGEHRTRCSLCDWWSPIRRVSGVADLDLAHHLVDRHGKKAEEVGLAA